MNLSAVNQGKYPTNPLFSSKRERIAFAAMITYIVLCLFWAMWYYTFGGW